MKIRISILFLHSMLITGLLMAGRLAAQTITTLHSFTATFPYVTNSDGIVPAGGLMFSDGTCTGRQGVAAVQAGEQYRRKHRWYDLHKPA